MIASREEREADEVTLKCKGIETVREGISLDSGMRDKAS